MCPRACESSSQCCPSSRPTRPHVGSAGMQSRTSRAQQGKRKTPQRQRRGCNVEPTKMTRGISFSLGADPPRPSPARRRLQRGGAGCGQSASQPRTRRDARKGRVGRGQIPRCRPAVSVTRVDPAAGKKGAQMPHAPLPMLRESSQFFPQSVAMHAPKNAAVR